KCGSDFKCASHLLQSYSVPQYWMSFCIVASCTPCVGPTAAGVDQIRREAASDTSSCSGHLVILMRRRSSVTSASGKLTWNERIAVVSGTACSCGVWLKFCPTPVFQPQPRCRVMRTRVNQFVSSYKVASRRAARCKISADSVSGRADRVGEEQHGPGSLRGGRKGCRIRDHNVDGAGQQGHAASCARLRRARARHIG